MKKTFSNEDREDLKEKICEWLDDVLGRYQYSDAIVEIITKD